MTTKLTPRPQQPLSLLVFSISYYCQCYGTLVTMQWVVNHKGVTGNTVADVLAQQCGLTPPTKHPVSLHDPNDIDGKMVECWNKSYHWRHEMPWPDLPMVKAALVWSNYYRTMQNMPPSLWFILCTVQVKLRIARRGNSVSFFSTSMDWILPRQF